MPTSLKHCLAIGVLAACACFNAAALGGQPQVIPLGARYIIHSRILHEDREVLIHVPEHYKETKRHYPVLVVLDGNIHLLQASGIVDDLSRNSRAPEMIVVAVPTLQRRMRDLTPPVLTDQKWKDMESHKVEPVGGADRFLGFLTDELRPWVDTHYRTEPYHILMGHSLGGLFNIVALVDRPDTFQAHIVASPSLWWDDRAYVKLAEKNFGQIKAPYFMFIAWSDHEPFIRDSSEELVHWLEANPLPGLRWKSAFYQNNTHGTVPHKALYDGLSALFDGWSPDLDMDRIEKVDYPAELAAFQKARSAKYGYDVAPQADESEALARWYIKKERFDDALKAAKLNLQRFPDYGRSYERMGEILDKTGHPAEALNYYRQAAKHPGEYGDIWQDAKKERELQAKMSVSR